MVDKNNRLVNNPYIISVLALLLIFPLISYFIEKQVSHTEPFLVWLILGKWFIFYAAGIRLFVAGLRRTTKPAFTAQQIFHMQGEESFPVIRELGFANLCFGLIGILSLFLPSWRIVSAFGSGLYYGMAGFMHVIKKPAGMNERFALVTDLFVFVLLACYFVVLF